MRFKLDLLAEAEAAFIDTINTEKFIELYDVMPATVAAKDHLIGNLQYAVDSVLSIMWWLGDFKAFVVVDFGDNSIDINFEWGIKSGT